MPPGTARMSDRAASELPPALSREQAREILLGAWKAINDNFYDRNFHGVDWQSLRAEFLGKIHGSKTQREIADLIRSMICRLDASHTLFLTRAEIKQRNNTLPFFFEVLDSRVFVSHVLRPRDPKVQARLEFGDELLEVDGFPATALQLRTNRVTKALEENPYVGSHDSLASVQAIRSGTPLVLKVPRLKRFSGFRVARLEARSNRVAYLRLLSLSASGLPPSDLRSMLTEAANYEALILDLRNNIGGDLENSLQIASVLLGAGHPFYTMVPREPGKPFHSVTYSQHPPDPEAIRALLKKQKRVLVRTYEEAVRFEGPIVVLVNGNTESEAELLAISLHEHNRVKILGTRTAGATSGWALGVSLPYGVGILSVPYTSSLSPNGYNYEGRGIEPDAWVKNSVEDFDAGRDVVIDAASKYLADQLRGSGLDN